MAAEEATTAMKEAAEEVAMAAMVAAEGAEAAVTDRVSCAPRTVPYVVLLSPISRIASRASGSSSAERSPGSVPR